jgi:hypothetical protein
LEAWASHKSFQPKDGPRAPMPPGRNTEVDFHGQRRTNDTHASTTDPEARMARKSMATAAKLSYAGHLLMEHRNALIVDIELTPATGYAERDTALEMLKRLPPTKRRRTLAGDKAYDTKGFVADLRDLKVTPHLAPNTTRQRSTIDGRTTRHEGHAASQRIRKRIEEPFGWIKTIAGGRKLRYKGQARNRAWFLMTGAVYNILRITALDATQRDPGPDWRIATHREPQQQPHQDPTDKTIDPQTPIFSTLLGGNRGGSRSRSTERRCTSLAPTSPI